MSYLFFVLHFRSRMLLSSAKQKKQILSDKRASYLTLSVIMGLQYILLLIEILINAGFIKKEDDQSILSTVGAGCSLSCGAKRRLEDDRMLHLISVLQVRESGPAMQTCQICVSTTA